MKWDLDLEAGSLYVYFRDAPSEVQREIEGVIVDLDGDGAVVGLEVLSVWAPVDWHAVASKCGLSDSDVVSLEFVASNLIVHILPTVGMRSEAVSPTRSAEPARVLISA